MSKIGHNGGPPVREGNWIAINREILAHHIVGAGQVVKPADPSRGAFSVLEAWLWCLTNAAYKPTTVLNKGREMTLEPGQVMAGRAYLAKTWNWSEMTVRWQLKRWHDLGMVTLATDRIRNQQTTNTANILTLCNWLKYQLQHDEQRGVNNQQTTSEQPASNQPTTSQQPQSNKETNKQLDCESNAREGETHAGNGVFVNCEAIRHRDFPISLRAIHMGVRQGALPFDEIKARCLAHALQWAEEIAQGKPARDVVPSKISNFLIRTIMNDINAEACSEVRLERAAKGPAGASRRQSPSGKTETEWERMSRLMGEPSRSADDIEIIPPARRL